MDIRNISWEQALPIRHQVLWPEREPLFCKVPGDETAKHYGVFVENYLVCVASVYLDGESARLRKFATLEAHQGKGFGSRLLEYILSASKAESTNFFWCDARESAVAFYKRFGMKVEGSKFFKSDQEYYKMSISLNLTKI